MTRPYPHSQRYPQMEVTMSEQYLSTAVRSYSVGLAGRSMNSVRNHHFVIDSPTIGEALGG